MLIHNSKMSASEKLTTYVCIADITITMFGSFTVILRYSVSEIVFVKLYCFFVNSKIIEIALYNAVKFL